MTMIRNKIRKRRQELNMSRVQLAEAVQVTPSAIANYENGISIFLSFAPSPELSLHPALPVSYAIPNSRQVWTAY